MKAVLEDYLLEQSVWLRGRNRILLLALGGWVASLIGWIQQPARFAVAYLIAYLFFLTIALGGLFFVMVQHLSGAVWSLSSRRIAENVMGVLPAAALLFLPVALHLHHLYEWTHADVVAADPALQAKQPYLNPAFFLARATVYLLLWAALARLLRGWSVSQDRQSPAAWSARKAIRWSAVGLPLTVITVTVAAFDWVMSLEPHWYSTVFGIYVYSGGAVAFVAVLVLLLLGLRRIGLLAEQVHREHYHDYGKWLFGLLVFWAYIAFSQYMLIWYANLPEETQWFRARTQGGWLPWAVLLAAGHFLLPFFALVSRGAKRNLKWLAAVSAWMLAMHYLDLYWQISPAFQRGGPAWHWLDAATLLAVGSALALAFWRQLRNAPLVPVGDPRLPRSLEFHNV
ncbi:MAG: hypothetical protein ACP5U2_05715 [Bryobacteraceae bacterium]